MAPGQMHLVEAAAFLVDTGPSLIPRHPAVGVIGEKFTKHNLVRPGATDGKCVANHGPLRFAEEAENLAQVMDQSGEDKPAWVAVLADLLGRLKQVFELGQLGVRIAV